MFGVIRVKVEPFALPMRCGTRMLLLNASKKSSAHCTLTARLNPTLRVTLAIVRTDGTHGLQDLGELSPLDQMSGAVFLGSGLIDHIQKMTIAAITMADMKVWAQRS